MLLDIVNDELRSIQILVKFEIETRRLETQIIDEKCKLRTFVYLKAA